MNNLVIKDILNIINGNLVVGNEDEVLDSFSINTKEINKDDVFIGIKGEKVDGSKYYLDALNNGAKGCIINKGFYNNDVLDDKFVIEVNDTVSALQNLSKYKRDLCKDLLIVGVTGSVGKTSTKDMIASVLSQKYKVLKTLGNHNNELGLPLTILRIKDEEAVVLEMGMSSLGEISLLSNIARPRYGVITNVGTAHIGNLGSRENILKAKLEILDGLQDKLIINNDNDLLHEWYLSNKNDSVVTFGINNESDYKANNVKYEGKTTFICNDDEYDVLVGGEAFVYNALSAISIGKLCGLTTEEIKKGIEELKLTKDRLQIIKTNNYTIIDDCYNANYDSMKEGLSNLKKTNGKRKIAVLGDMLELGDFEEELHRKVGKEVVNNNIDILVTVGNASRYIIDEAKDKLETHAFDTNEDAISYLKSIVKDEDVILVKASNGMHFIEIVNSLRG